MADFDKIPIPCPHCGHVEAYRCGGNRIGAGNFTVTCGKCRKMIRVHYRNGEFHKTG